MRTRVGYCGGTTSNPTYRNMGDHTESIAMDYLPELISYTQLLELFWDNHSPTSRSFSRQYMAIVFPNDHEQYQLAVASKDRVAKRYNKTVHTEILDNSMFYLAEDYHQKYYLQNKPELIKEFRSMFPSFPDFINSTVAARVNGYLAGYGTLSELEAELELFGLSAPGKEELVRLVGKTRR